MAGKRQHRVQAKLLSYFAFDRKDKNYRNWKIKGLNIKKQKRFGPIYTTSIENATVVKNLVDKKTDAYITLIESQCINYVIKLIVNQELINRELLEN